MRKLALAALILLSIPILHYLLYDALVVRRSSSAALASFAGVNLASELSRKVPPDPGIATVRSVAGNAAVDYQKAFYGGEVSEEKLPFIEAGAIKESCLFTSMVLPVPDNLLELPVPNLVAARKLGDMMIEKARGLEAAGDIAGAERELLLLLSFGNHLESEYTLYSFLVGVDRQKAAADYLEGYYRRRGQMSRVAEMSAQSREMTRLRAVYKKHLPDIARLTTDEEGRKLLFSLYTSPRIPAGLKSEIIFHNSMHHIYYFTGVLYGPGKERREFRGELMKSPDPLLREFAEKSDSLLNLGIRQRIQAVHQVEVID